ncbi:hypothetical protein PACTADRAFT_49690 [Pachysolen tannophilus NRRL Y-2460]|uniref:Phosphatase n=1 Tax=Pachysolen tannophilus NRRL Y-2460 TaxID=669874 RepID=A0A1E4TX56_PACTA|nr:hypothetical protein PACTADRAFT_49690 [Pachysolen tannophilus NRRL Y-2460]
MTTGIDIYDRPMTLSEKVKAKAILFSDFDGTITLQDSNDHMTHELGFGKAKRLEVNNKILAGDINFREGFREMLDSIHAPFDECVQFLLDTIELDSGFIETHRWCTENNIPVVVVSSGMKPIILALLKKLVGEKECQNIEIIANDVKINDDGTWDIVYRHEDSGFGHDKSRSLKPYSSLPKGERPILFYCGDGVSDLSAARETDLLFAKRGKDLIKFCERENIKYTQFDSFKDILNGVKAIVSGEKNIKDFVENKN